MVAIAIRLALRYTGQKLNPEEAKYPAIAKIGRIGTVADRHFRRRKEGDDQEG